MLKLVIFNFRGHYFLLNLGLKKHFAYDEKIDCNSTSSPVVGGRKIHDYLIFEKASTRTRCPIETTAYNQGAI